MAFITIVENEGKNYLTAFAGVYSETLGYSELDFWGENISSVTLDANTGIVILKTKYSPKEWLLSFEISNKALKVDSVKGVARCFFHPCDLSIAPGEVVVGAMENVCIAGGG